MKSDALLRAVFLLFLFAFIFLSLKTECRQQFTLQQVHDVRQFLDALNRRRILLATGKTKLTRHPAKMNVYAWSRKLAAQSIRGLRAQKLIATVACNRCKK